MFQAPDSPGGYMCEAQPHSVQVAEPGEEGPDVRPHLPRSSGAGVREGTLEEAGAASSGEQAWLVEWPGVAGHVGKAWPVSAEGEGARVLERAPWWLPWEREGGGPSAHNVLAQGGVQQWEEPTGPGVLASCWS